MNKTEAVHIDQLMRWITGEPSPSTGEPVTADAARHAAVELARRASTALGAGVTPQRVENSFTDDSPHVVRGPAFVVDLNPTAVRRHFAGEDAREECWDCEDNRPHHCDRQRVELLADESLQAAAFRVLGKQSQLDDALDDAMAQILDLAEDEQARAARVPA